MRWHKSGVLLIVCVLMLGLMAVPAAAEDVGATLWHQWMSITPVAYDGFGDSVAESRVLPDVQGDWVVYCETADAGVDWNIRAYNMRTRETRTVCSAAGVQNFARVYGDWVVWQDARLGGTDTNIWAYNLATSTEKQLTNRAGNQQMPDISGTKVVYTDAAAGDLYVYDLVTNTDSVLPLGAGTQANGAISGERVVYVQSENIWFYDLRNATPPLALTNDAVADGAPDIDGTLVAWQRQGASIDIWTQDLEAVIAPAAMPLGSTTKDEGWPRVDDKHVVFMRDDAGDFNIGVFDALAGLHETLTSDTNDDVLAAIDGPNIVYTSGFLTSGSVGGDIVLGRLVAPVFTAKAAAGTINYGAKTTISGSLTENGIPLGNLPIAIDASYDNGHHWTQVATTNTDPNGAFAYATEALWGNRLYRARHNGSLGFIYVDRFSALSAPVSVKVRASVGRPTGYPSSGRKTKYYSVYGSLKPRQPAAAAPGGPVVIKCYRKQNGKYVLRKTVSTRVYDYDWYSRYRASVRLPYAGTWRIRAYFVGSSNNDPKYSSYRYVRVY